MATRVERDSVGAMEVPENAYYGVQSQRAMENFPITGRVMHPVLIDNIVRIKKAAALANCEAGALNQEASDAIVRACDEVLAGNLREHFIVDCIQGGAGTSANMNVNEVIANRALELLGEPKGSYTRVHPNDHVNEGQSTNDVYPTAGKLSVYMLIDPLLASLGRMIEALEKKAEELDDVVKMGRTQLQDAVPVRVGQSFRAYASVIRRDVGRIDHARQEMRVVNLGGTAIGTALNANKVYLQRVLPILSEIVGFELERAEDMIDATQNTDGFSVVSGALKTCAMDLSKISNDLRLLSSGPKTGISEIILPPKQNGSSIMPGKINPVIPEVVNQVAFKVAGNDVTVSMACEAGQLELNAFEPVMLQCLFESVEMLTHAVDTLVVNCIDGIVCNRERCTDLVRHSAGIITALCPVIGYTKAANIAKKSLKTGVSVYNIARTETDLSQEEIDRLLDLRAMTINPLECGE